MDTLASSMTLLHPENAAVYKALGDRAKQEKKGDESSQLYKMSLILNAKNEKLIEEVFLGSFGESADLNALEKYTERLLKREGITFLRIDHAGKEKAKGPRGGSAKQGDVDITWLIESHKEGNLRITSNSHRFPLEHNSLIIKRVSKPVLHHELVVTNKRMSAEERLNTLVECLDNNHEPTNLTVKETAEALRKYGEKVSNDVASNVARIRKQHSEAGRNLDEGPSQTNNSAPPWEWGWINHSRIQHEQIRVRNTHLKHTVCNGFIIPKLPTDA